MGCSEHQRGPGAGLRPGELARLPTQAALGTARWQHGGLAGRVPTSTEAGQGRGRGRGSAEKSSGRPGGRSQAGGRA